VGQGDGLLVSADRNPNVRGALVTGLIKTLPDAGDVLLSGPGDATPSSRKADSGEGAAAPENLRAGGLAQLGAQIEAGQVRTVLSVGEDLAAAGLSEAQLGKIAVIYLGTHANATSTVAKVVIPTLTVFEKAGTFINQQFRLQKFAPAVPGLTGVADDLATLAKLLLAAGGPALAGDIAGVWAALTAEVKPLATVSYENLPATGLLLDGSPFADLPFAEGESLHFAPAKPAGVAP
jgi:NADH-quinone oxidoreductase subunit G